MFDYYVDEQNVCMAHWSQRVPAFTYAPDNFASLFVPTVETTRLSYLLDLLVPNQHHVMFVGNTGARGGGGRAAGAWQGLLHGLRRAAAATPSCCAGSRRSDCAPPTLLLHTRPPLQARARRR